MEKFAIKLVKGDNNTILEMFIDKQEALTVGEIYRSKYTIKQGFISCIQADFDEHNNLVGNAYKLINAWR